MLKEFVDKILDIAPIEGLDFDGIEYTSKPIHVVQQALALPVKTHTLTGLVDILTTDAGIVAKPETVAIHVVSHSHVEIVEKGRDKWNRKQVWAAAGLVEGMSRFKFGSWYEAEQFIIDLQASFLPNETRTKILELVGNMTAGREISASDDGVTQQVNVKAGVTLKASKVVPNPVTLAPYRTFLEIEQPESDYVFRVKQLRDGDLPSCSLHEADGGLWKLTAIERIKAFFKEKTPNISCIA